MNALIDFLHSNWIYIAGVIGALLSFASITNQTGRESFSATIFDSLKSKSINSLAGNSKGQPLVSHADAVKISARIKNDLIIPLETVIGNKGGLLGRTWDALNDDEKAPLKRFWFVCALILLLGFMWADATVLANTLAVSPIGQLLPTWLSPYVSNYELSVMVGTFLTVIVIAMAMSDLFGNTHYTELSSKTGGYKRFWKAMTIFLFGSVFGVIVPLALLRISIIESHLPVSWIDTINSSFNIATCLLVPVNTILTTILLSEDAYKGVLTLCLLIVAGLSYSVMLIADAFLRVIYSLGVPGVEILVLLVYIITATLAFLLLTPLSVISWARPNVATTMKPITQP